jgi:hypothetical protein
MNLDFALVNRALQNLGLSPISEADRAAGNADWLTAREYFLQTMLEALAQVEWTSAKRRRDLLPAQLPFKRNHDFSFAYVLPLDCAKPIELDGQEYFEVEANLLYTTAAPARLLYISNGRRFIDQTSLAAGAARRPPPPAFVSGGDARRACRYEGGDNIVIAGTASRPAPPPPPEESEDFPDYRNLDLEPNFYLYWENLLSAKYALRLTDKPDLSVLYFNKAQSIGRAAQTISIQHSAARRTANPTWQEKLGLA